MSDLGVAVIIEDDTDMRNLIEGVLLQSGFEVHTATCGREGVELVRDASPDVVTLDVGLPDIDGFEVLRRIRRFSNAYVVMLTGRTEETDLLTALHGGADDYIIKPFRPREMRARITAMMRRQRPQSLGGGPSPSPEPSPPVNSSPEDQSRQPVLRHNGLALDCRTRSAAVGGTALELTRSEFDILQELIRGAGAVLSKKDLARALRGEYYREEPSTIDSDERAVEVHIGNLRRKLRDDPESPRWLQTVRGVGYRLATDD
ncbi:two-component system OmpR family response regulator [Arthrobacter pascens]|uniref:response regulator transcription factor n=1 Tax=Arthrobacter pascens TaxID=1677 RepID=UPI00278E94EE|nr:response regulator transcription factor [Arthrobacter pascens]MDQ0677306.1 two-component system OmpR family response regulator [Arthrobacter pascens]